MAMDMTVDCPKCGMPLRVPEAAAGRRGRCTECGSRFTIPSMSELLENTVSHFMLASLEAEDEAEDAMEDTAGSAGGAPSSSETFAAVPAVDARQPGDDEKGVLSDDRLGPPQEYGLGEDDHTDLIDISQDMTEAEAESAAREPAASPDDSDAKATGDKDGSTADVAAPTQGGYPQEVMPTDPRPYMVVRNCAMEGVRLAFNARWLKHETFRTSMPMRCAFTGDENTHELIARPMIFLKKYEGPDTPLHSLETRHETKVASNPSPRALARSMGHLEHFHEPFYLPLVFYITPSSASNSLTCEANTDHHGRTVCEVLIPNHRTALLWLERVNGRCGVEYALLKNEIAHYTSDAWRKLPDKTRQRLAIWCRFEKGERFRLYLNDPDFTSADAGLAGVAVTDRRLLYHKYRRSRSVSLHQDAVLHITTDGKIARLALQASGRVAQCGKVHRDDISELVSALADAPRLRVEVRKREHSAA